MHMRTALQTLPDVSRLGAGCRRRQSRIHKSGVKLRQSNTKIPFADYQVLRQFAARQKLSLQDLMTALVAPAAEAIRRGDNPLGES